MPHHGKVLEKAIRESGYSLALVSRKTKISRRHFYNLFLQEIIKIDVFLKVGKVINHDFTADIKDIAQLKNTTSALEDTEYWKNKYLQLLEKFNELLSEGMVKYLSKKK